MSRCRGLDIYELSIMDLPMHCPSPFRSPHAVAGVASGLRMASRAGAEHGWS
jgi:hypothetical protein